MSVGLVLGERYELSTQLGTGGFGTVWRAHDRRLDRDVALKLLHLDGPDVGRFEREARALAQLNHPNVVTAHDYGVDGSQAYLVMELINGRSLAGIMASAPDPGRLSLDWTLGIVEQILEGLAAAHAVGFVHRDLKPQNIMVTTDNRHVKIVDFGIAYVLGTSRMTQTGTVMGSLPYISPEQLDARPADARSDLYSLGCLLHEMLTGGSPYRADTPAGWIAAHAVQTPEHVRDHVPDVPPSVDDFVFRLLAKNPDDRPQTATAALDDLRALRGTASRGPAAARPGSVVTANAASADALHAASGASSVGFDPAANAATAVVAGTTEALAPPRPHAHTLVEPGGFGPPPAGPRPMGPPVGPPGVPSSNRTKVLILVAAIVAVLIVAGVGVAIALNGKGNATAGPGHTPAATGTGQPSTDPTTAGGGGGGSTPPSTPASSPPPADAAVHLVNSANGNCLAENTGGGIHGLHLGPCTEPADENWTLKDDGTIVNATSGNCLSVASDHARLFMLPCNGGDAQVWDQAAITGKFVATVNATRLCLAGDPDTIDTDAAKMRVTACGDDPTQVWTTPAAG